MRKALSIFAAICIFCLLGEKLIAQAPPKPRDSTITGPQTFAMVMGISAYKYVRPLEYADKDAEMFKDFLKSPSGGKLSDDNIYILLNDQATLANFYTKGFAWLKAKKLQKGDRLFIYLAGHGDAIDEDQFFYLAYDCDPAGDKNNYLVGGAVQLFNLKKKIAAETAIGVEVYFIMDACRSNELPGGVDGQNFLNQAISEKRAGEIIMLATGAGEKSLEDASIGNGHGLFTYYLVNGLVGEADSIVKADGKVTLEEIQKYVDKNVPAEAQQRFKQKQDPFFCCNENSSKVVSIVDTAYLRKWEQMKKLQAATNSHAMVLPKTRGISGASDTSLVETYNNFNRAVKESRLTGNQSAEFFYQWMERNFPGNSYTLDAQSTLAVEFINFAQSKINLYLECKDAASVQKLRAQIDDDEKTDEVNTGFDRMEKVARQEYYEVGDMLEKAIRIISPDDSDFANSLKGRMYFFKARGYYSGGIKQLNIQEAFNYAYAAYARDKNAAYILNTLSNLHMDNYRYDSAIFYAYRAIAVAPKWRYPYVTLAFCYKTLSKPDSAIKYYTRSILLDSMNADAWVDLGHYYFSLGKGDSAIYNYNRALSLEPNNVFASNNIGWLYYQQKDFLRARDFFKRSIQADYKFINAYNGMAKTFFETGEYDSARIYYSKAFENYQDKSIVNIYIGNFFRELKSYDSAKVYYRYAAQLDSTYEEAFNNLGQTSEMLKQRDSAIYYFHKALIANPASAYSLVNLGLVYKELKISDSTFLYFHKATDLEPNNPSILNSLGVLFAQDKSGDSAKNYFRRALKARPDYKPASKNLLKLFKDLNQVDSVTNFIRSTSLVDPGSAAFMNELGMAFYEVKRYDSASIYLRNAIKKDMVNPLLYNNIGLVFMGAKQYDSARKNFLKANRIMPENMTYVHNLSNVYRQLNKLDSSAYYFEKEIFKQLGPGIDADNRIGAFYGDVKLYDSSINYYKKALQLNANYSKSYIRVGEAYLNMELYDSALVYLRKGVELDSNSKGGNLSLGLTYHSLQKFDSSIFYLTRAVRLDPSKSKTFFDLACSYNLNNEPEKAILNLQMAFQHGFKNTDALLTDPDLNSLKKVKEFQNLLDKYVPDWRTK